MIVLLSWLALVGGITVLVGPFLLLAYLLERRDSIARDARRRNQARRIR